VITSPEQKREREFGKGEREMRGGQINTFLLTPFNDFDFHLTCTKYTYEVTTYSLCSRITIIGELPDCVQGQ